MEIYFRYLEGCRNFNELNDLPEEGWEWHHTLPRCIFGEQPFGLWLTPKQHAIATALQTLIFNKCCLFGGQLPLLPPQLRFLVAPIYSNRSKTNGSFQGKENVRLRRGFWDPCYQESRQDWRRRGGEKTGTINQEKLGKRILAVVNSNEVIFPSVREASRQTGIPTSNISKVCKGKRQTAGGIRFAYLD